MNNEITIDPDEIRSLPDSSVINAEEIRQIALYANKTGDTSLAPKIADGYEFLGLYPEVSTHPATEGPELHPQLPQSVEILPIKDRISTYELREKEHIAWPEWVCSDWAGKTDNLLKKYHEALTAAEAEIAELKSK